jgi:NAD(P)H-dependent FMN reductase
MLNIALIVGSTRPNRFADTPVMWLVEGARARTDFKLEVLDLREQGLKFYDEAAPASSTGGRFSDPAAETWRTKIGEFDAYIATVAEYNHGPTAVLKNAIDSALYEWGRKPIAFVGYGGVGGARAIEILRGVAGVLDMAAIKAEVNIAMEPFMAILSGSKALDDFPYLVQSRQLLFDDLVWWGQALKQAREGISRPQPNSLPVYGRSERSSDLSTADTIDDPSSLGARVAP